MTSEATTKMLTVDQVAARLHVAKSTVEQWVYDKELASFKKGSSRRVSEESLARFVLLHTLNPRRPDWLTAAVESDFWNAQRAIVKQEVEQVIWLMEQQRKAAA